MFWLPGPITSQTSSDTSEKGLSVKSWAIANTLPKANTLAHTLVKQGMCSCCHGQISYASLRSLPQPKVRPVWWSSSVLISTSSLAAVTIGDLMQLTLQTRKQETECSGVCTGASAKNNTRDYARCRPRPRVLIVRHNATIRSQSICDPLVPGPS